MLASYKNLSGVDASQYTIFSVRPLGLWYYVALLICAVGAAFSLLLPSAYAFFAGNILDTGIWLLLLTWVVWTHLLKSTRRKELLKEMLDDARSKSSLPLKPSEPEFHYGLYALFGVVVAALILGISYLRVSKSQGVYSLNTLKKCIQTTKTLEVNHFLSTGKYGSALHQSQCIDEFSKELTINVVFQSAELELFAQEKNFSDFFENSRKGDQYLSLGANGKFSIR